MRQVWTSALASLERSLQHEEFSEFKQAANLRAQICRLLCHLLCAETDLMAVPCQPLPEPALTGLTDCLNAMQASEGDSE